MMQLRIDQTGETVHLKINKATLGIVSVWKIVIS